MAQCPRAHPLELFIHLTRKAADLAIIEPVRNEPLLGFFEALDRFALLVKIARVFDFGFNRLHLIASGGREMADTLWSNGCKKFGITRADNLCQVFNHNLWTPEQLRQWAA